MVSLTITPRDLAEGRAQGEPIFLICRSGARAGEAQLGIQSAGFANAVVVHGGTLARERAKSPVEPAMALERQVRIAAGSLVVIGAAPWAFVLSAFTGLAAFVGGGLVFTGVTDARGKARLLGRMPWIQAPVGERPRPVVGVEIRP